MKDTFHHALKIDRDLCIGCAHCMRVCPTEALRVHGGKARLEANHCIDCGECFRTCPVNAIIIEQDDFGKTRDYPYCVAIIPAVFTGQFPEDISTEEIHSSLKHLGFTHICEAESAVELVYQKQQQTLSGRKLPSPAISAFCPAIVRLIQVKFPSLVPHILPVKSPLDVTAAYYRQKLKDQGTAEKDVGIFYVTPCAAKIAAVKSPVGEESSCIDGVINMDFLYNKVYTLIRQKRDDFCAIPDRQQLSPKDILWSLTNGEKDHVGSRSLAIDGINNVTAFLERVENDEMGHIDFLELRSCDESCAGGVLTGGNRFLTAQRLRKRADKAAKDNVKDIMRYQKDLMNQISTSQVEPRSMLILDNDVSMAIRKMKQIHSTMERLPRVDCTVCGAPSCSALARDVVQGKASIKQCIFVQKRLEQKDLMNKSESLDILRGIWGKAKLDKNR